MGDDLILMGNILKDVPKKASKEFKAMLKKGVQVFTSLSHNHTSIEESSDQTRDTFKELKVRAVKGFEDLYALLEMRKKEFLEGIDKREAERLEEIDGFMKKIERKQSQLKGKLFDCNLFMNCESEDNLLHDFIGEIDANPLIPPKTEYQIVFDTTIESMVKSFGSITNKTAAEVSGVEVSVNESTVDEERVVMDSNGENDVEDSDDDVMIIDEDVSISDDTNNDTSDHQISRKEVVGESSRTDRSHGKRNNQQTRRNDVKIERKKFSCDYPDCEKRFYDKWQLNQHQSYHSDLRPYACDWPDCGKAFKQRSDRKKHIRYVHEKERPHICDVCNKAFIKRDQLKRHEEDVHDIY